MKHLYS